MKLWRRLILQINLLTLLANLRNANVVVRNLKSRNWLLKRKDVSFLKFLNNQLLILAQPIQIKRENESPEVVIYEPNVTIVASPTRTQSVPQTSATVPEIETEATETSKRQLRQRKPSEEKQTVSPDLTKVEIKREESVDVQPMEGNIFYKLNDYPVLKTKYLHFS